MTNNIGLILKQQGRTQMWLSIQLGVVSETVSLWCRNKHQPSITTLKYISVLLNVEYSELINNK